MRVVLPFHRSLIKPHDARSGRSTSVQDVIPDY